MSGPSGSVGSVGEPTSGRRLPVAPFLEILARHRGLIVLMTVVAGVVGAGFSLIAPVTYESKLTILPPESASPLDFGRGSLQSSLASLQVGFATSTASALYSEMLLSRSVRRYAIDKLGLIQAYGITEPDSLTAHTHALDRLEDDLYARSSSNGLIYLTARAHTGYFPSRADKQRTQRLAAAIGNALAEGLDAVNQEKNTNQARQARIYLEDQVARTDATLDSVSRALVDFQRMHLAVSLDDQMRVSIETAGVLEGELLAKQVALGVAQQNMLPANPLVRRLEGEIRALRDQIADLRKSGPYMAAGSTAESGMGLEQLPEISRRYALFLRDVKIQETVYQLLTEQLYQARIQETETLPVVQVLDEANVPIYKKSPIVRKVALIAAFLGFLSAVFLAHAMEWWRQYPYAEVDVAAVRRLWRRK